MMNYISRSHFLLLVTLFTLATSATPAGDMSPLLRRQVEAEFATLRPRATSTDLQPFTGSLGGTKAPPITNSGDTSRPFAVDGNTFDSFSDAASRACSIQDNACADASNSAGNAKTFSVQDCTNQQTQCLAAASSATDTSFAVLTSENADFEFFCDP